MGPVGGVWGFSRETNREQEELQACCVVMGWDTRASGADQKVMKSQASSDGSSWRKPGLGGPQQFYGVARECWGEKCLGELKTD